jgi:hypothetical protein
MFLLPSSLVELRARSFSDAHESSSTQEEIQRRREERELGIMPRFRRFYPADDDASAHRCAILVQLRSALLADGSGSLREVADEFA